MTQRMEINHSHPSSWLQEHGVGGGCDIGDGRGGMVLMTVVMVVGGGS